MTLHGITLHNNHGKNCKLNQRKICVVIVFYRLFYLANQINKINKKFQYGPCCEKTCLWGFANGTGADQPGLISAFVIPFVESIICKFVTDEFSFSSQSV